MRAVLRAFVLLVALVALVGSVAAYSIARRGLSTRVEPSVVETWLARSMRRLATPSEVRDRENPVDASEAVLEEAMSHFADHCASCHANDGSGNTEIGRGLYPPAPDMRLEATQALSDGELFSIIENGIRLTGMPAWGTGTPDGERASWGLVHFIRRLQELSPADIERMEEMNPKTMEQIREEEAIRRFLAGEDPVPAPPDSAGHEESHP